jgi:hypothetical protein
MARIDKRQPANPRCGAPGQIDPELDDGLAMVETSEVEKDAAEHGGIPDVPAAEESRTRSDLTKAKPYEFVI